MHSNNAVYMQLINSKAPDTAVLLQKIRDVIYTIMQESTFAHLSHRHMHTCHNKFI